MIAGEFDLWVGSTYTLSLSALLTTTMPNFKGLLQALEDASLHQNVKVLIGGASVTTEYAREIGADGYAPAASRAVAMVKKCL